MAWAAVGLVLLVSTTFGMLAALETYRGKVALAEAETASDHGDGPGAIAAARVAIEAHVPGTDHAERASLHLESLANRALNGRDTTTAALALRVARQGAEAIGDDARAAQLRERERALELASSPKAADPSVLPVDGSGAPPARQPRELRATGTGRGRIGLGPRLAIGLGIGLLTAALVGALRRPALSARLCLALSAAGTVVLAAARFFA